MAAPVIQFKRGLFSNLPGLRVGEPGFTTDKYDLYVGIDSTTNGNKFFGSHRYWTKETTTAGSGVNLVEGTDNGENKITLKAPASLASDLTLTFPSSITTGGYLKVASDGTLEWDDTLDATNVNATGVGTVAFLQSTTVNVSAGATVTGALDVDGGADISGGLTVSGSQTVDQVSVSGVVTATSFVGDVTGDLTGNVTGNADTATALATARDFSASGDASASAVSFDGTGNVDLALTLATVNSDVGSYGSQTQIPVVTVNAKGLVTAVSTASVGTALTVSGDSGSEDINLLTETLSITGGSNVTTSAASNGVSVALDDNISLVNVNATGITTSADIHGTNANISGIVTATSFSTGTTGSAIVVNSSTITGPSSITIDPASLNDNSGTVYILGDLQVKGTTTQIDSTTVTVADLNIQVATGAANDAAANGAGFTVDSGDGDKTFQFEALGDNFGSSENLNLATGKVYKINNTEVLSATALSNSISVDLASLDIDGGTAATAVTADDLFIIDDGAGGTNKKVTAQLLSDYVLGGSGGATFTNVNVTGIGTVNQFNAADANITGVATASSFAGSDFRDTDGSLVPLVGVSSNTAHTGLVTAFKFYGTGLEEYIVADEIASIKISGVAASTYTTSQTVSATEGQTAFTFSAGYEDGFIDAYLNGIRLVPGVDFSTAANNTSVNLVSGATAGDELEMVAYKSLGNIYSLNQLTVAESLTVTGVATAGSFNGALNFTGVSTAGQLQTTDVNASGIITATTFVGNLDGGLVNSRNFSASGDASASNVAFDATGDVDLALTLATVNSDVGSYGSTTQIPVVTVNAKGLVTAVTTASVGTALTVTGDSGSEQIDLLTESLAITGGTNITSSAASNGVSVALDSDISLTSVTTNTLTVSGISTQTGNANFGGNVTITGDLTVNGTTTQINTNNTTIEDTLLELQRVDGGALASDTNKDVGLVLNYFDGSAKKAAVYWDDSAARFALTGDASESSGVLTAASYASLEIGGLYLNDCAGASQVISCSGTTRSLENITIDGGTF